MIQPGQERLRAFAVRLLTRRGALVDWPEGAEKGLAILPAEAARALGCAEEAPLSHGAGEQGLAVSLNSPFLDQVAPLVEAEPFVGRFRAPDLYLKKGGMAEAVERAFTWLNAKVLVRHAQPTRVEYQTWTFRASLRSDDQWDELVTATFNPRSGAEVDFPDPLASPDVQALPPAGDIAEKTYQHAARQALRKIQMQAQAFIERMEARLERDRARLREYYGALLRDAGRRPSRMRREIPRQEYEDKKRAVDLELRRKLAELNERYELRVKLTPIALVRTETPVLAVQCDVFRKKARALRDIYWNAVVKQLEPLACSHCGANIFAVAFSDDEVAPLCLRCSSG